VEAVIPSVDLPINSFLFDAFLFIFIPQRFAVVVDVSKSPPRLFSVPPACIGLADISDRAIPFGRNYLVDLENGHVFKIEMVFDSLVAARLRESRCWTLMASIVARFLNSEIIAGFFDLVITQTSTAEAWAAIMDFFDCLIAAREFTIDPLADPEWRRDGLAPPIAALVEDFERSFPASGPVSRVNSFWALVQTALKNENFDQSFQKAILVMKTENEIVSYVHNGIEDWLEKFDPPSDMRFKLFTMVNVQTILHKLPDVPQLLDKLDAIPPEARAPNLTVTLMRLARSRTVAADDAVEDLASITSWHVFPEDAELPV
jgi:hypothetical protein